MLEGASEEPRRQSLRVRRANEAASGQRNPRRSHLREAGHPDLSGTHRPTDPRPPSRAAGLRAQPGGYCDNFPDKGVRSEEHTSELQSLMRTSYAVFCLKKKTNYKIINNHDTTTDT